MMDHDFGSAQDAREQLRQWDGGGAIWSIEIGGLGPGYEQAIQVLAIEIVRDEIDKPMPITALAHAERSDCSAHQGPSNRRTMRFSSLP